MPGFLHNYWRLKMRSLCLGSKHLTSCKEQKHEFFTINYYLLIQRLPNCVKFISLKQLVFDSLNVLKQNNRQKQPMIQNSLKIKIAELAESALPHPSRKEGNNDNVLLSGALHSSDLIFSVTYICTEKQNYPSFVHQFHSQICWLKLVLGIIIFCMGFLLLF